VVTRALPPKLVVVGVDRRAVHRAAASSAQAMDGLIQQLRGQRRTEEADAMTRLRDEWVRAAARAVEATR